jgi:F-type H+-transporting ATPase subunit alpha
MEDQVITIFVVGRGLIDEVPVDKVGKFEKEFLSFIAQSHPNIRATIKDTGEVSGDTTEEITRLCQEFLKDFS